MASADSNNIPPVMRIDVSSGLILKLIGIYLGFLLIAKIWGFLLLLVLSIFVAVTLQPVLDWLTRRGLSRRTGLTVLSLVTIALFIGLILFLVPPLVNEMGALSNSLPMMRQEILKNTPAKLGLNGALQRILTAPQDASHIVSGLVSFGQYAVSATIDLLMLMVFSIYFLVDGPRAYRWLLPYFSARNQRRISATVDEVLIVVSAYISGQMLTSVLATVFSFVVLASFGVPAALSLSVMAGIFDILPVIGFFLFAVPACLLAVTVSWKTALLVLGIYTVYHLIESYVIIPKVYGPRMRLSALVILVGIVVTNYVAGVLGAIAILPVLASYPIIERIWLARQVGSAAVEEHKVVLPVEA